MKNEAKILEFQEMINQIAQMPQNEQVRLEAVTNMLRTLIGFLQGAQLNDGNLINVGDDVYVLPEDFQQYNTY
ncbi:MAG: hypothetical protein K2J20_01290, partial [Bacilli bacterium]|nr:hypothetical protein [Bacilli bacterium]